ncbi:MAG TPA: DUF4199 domain-containing protein [Puia sp.]|nr:DUF4199 domain-containing protein [Puia sp.]
MKRNILIFGLIAGLILGLFTLSITILNGKGTDAPHSEIVGYTAMVVAFSFIFVGTKNFRDKYNGGVVSFGKALRIGLGITLIGSTMYVIAWMIEYYLFIPDFMDKYAAHMIHEIQASGVSPAAMNKQIAEINHMSQLYKNPVFVALFTYVEVLPVGIIISLLTSLLLKRKTPRPGKTQLAV